MSSPLYLVCVCLLIAKYSDAFLPGAFKPELNKPTSTKKPATEKPRPILTNAESQTNQIPTHILKKLRQVNNMNDFIQVFNIKDVKVKQVDVVTERPPTPVKASKEFMVNVWENGKFTRMGLSDDKVRCTPRPEVVSLPPPKGYASMYYPSCVTSNRCSGCCIQNENVKCAPSKKVVEKKTVFEIFYAGGYQTRVVDVTSHTECSCQCLLNDEKCGPKLGFDPNSCRCKCMKKEETCSDAIGGKRQWSTRECGCICSSRVACPVHREWDEKYCKCRCVSTPCPINSYRDRNTCECRYATRMGKSFRCYAVDDKK